MSMRSQSKPARLMISALMALQRVSQEPAVGRPSRKACFTWLVFTQSTSVSLFLDTALTVWNISATNAPRAPRLHCVSRRPDGEGGPGWSALLTAELTGSHVAGPSVVSTGAGVHYTPLMPGLTTARRHAG